MAANHLVIDQSVGVTWGKPRWAIVSLEVMQREKK